MIIWGFGRITNNFKGGVSEKMCTHCNTNSIWQLCIMKTWFTLFFIPIVPYKKQYCIMCPKCKSYIEIKKDKYIEELESINNQKMLVQM